MNQASHESGGRFAVRKMTVTAVMAAAAAVLMFLSFPVPLMPPFIRMDFSELPALVTAYALGPFYGALVCLIKNLVNLTRTNTNGVGELSNFFLGVCFVVPASLLYRWVKHRKGAVLGSLVGAATMALMSIPLNYYLIFPIYTAVMPMETILNMYRAINPHIEQLWQALLMFNMPFTLVKGLASALICFAIYKQISGLIKGK